MARIRAQVRGLGEPFTGLMERMSRPRPLMRQWGRAIQLSQQEEFIREVYFRPSGGVKQWKKTEAFGSRPAPANTGRDTGALYNAVKGGKGSVFKATDQQVEVGVDLEYAQYFRGGLGRRPRLSPWKQVVTPKMRAFFAWKFGVRLKATTTKLTHYRRPYGSVHPKLTAFFKTSLVSYVEFGRIPNVNRRLVSP